MEMDFFDGDDSISSWEEVSAASTRQEDSKPIPSEEQMQGYTQIDSLRTYIQHTMRSAKDRKTLKLIEAALESIRKFDATYEKVASLRCERVQFAVTDEAESDQQEVDDENADCEPEPEILTIDQTLESEDLPDTESETYEDPSSGSDCAEDEEIDPARLKQHRRFLQLVVQHTNEFLRSGAGLRPSPPSSHALHISQKSP